MKILISLILIGISFGIKAQPGYQLVKKNINDYTLAEIETSKILKNNYYRYAYILDGKTNLSNIKNIRSLHQITINANLKALPKEVYFMADSLKELTLYAGKELVDLSELQQLKNIESITIINYNGESLPVLSRLINLKKLIITADYYNKDNLKYINGIALCKSLKYLELNYSSIKMFDLDMSNMSLEKLTISGCNYLENIDAITNCTYLKTLELYSIPIKRLPGNMNLMTALETLYLSNTNGLTDIDNLAGMKSLKSFSLNTSNTNLTEILKSFNTNLNIENVYIDLTYGYNLKSAEGLTYLKKLKSVTIVCPHFKLPVNFNTCKNLESIELVSADSISISRINHLDKLKKIDLSNCNFLKIPDNIYSNNNLEDVSIAGNKTLINVEDIVRFKKLNRLTLKNNAALKLIPNFKKSMPLLGTINTDVIFKND